MAPINLDNLPAWLPAWALNALLFLLAIVGAVVIHRLLFGVARRLVRSRGLFIKSVVERTKGPGRLGLVIIAVSVMPNIVPMSPAAHTLTGQVLLIAFIVLLGWTALIALHVGSVVYSRRFKLDIEDNLVARKHITQVRILERTAAAFIVLLTLAAALMTLDAVRQYGVTLLASAGAAGIIAGLALQPLLTNLIAGIQIALTQPIRIDDAVIVENEWGWVEEVNATYVVVRLWDWRRMILPLTYFIQRPFQNWTREGASLIGSAMLYVDYDAPIDAMRAKLAEIVQASSRWDRNVLNLAVTDLTERTMQVRCLMSARNAGDAFDLRCEVREKMIAWLRDAYPQALPQDRFRAEQMSMANAPPSFRAADAPA